jgi:hypothetical protein
MPTYFFFQVPTSIPLFFFSCFVRCIRSLKGGTEEGQEAQRAERAAEGSKGRKDGRKEERREGREEGRKRETIDSKEGYQGYEHIMYYI